MNAISANSTGVREDTDILTEVILYIDPNAANAHSPAYRKVRAKLLALGWPQHRFDAAVLKLKSSGRLFLSRSRKTISFKPIGNPHSRQKKRCVYCGKVTKKLTKDHVIPKAKGGAKHSSNIVMACRPCNQVKADRTPAEWAKDILAYHKRAS